MGKRRLAREYCLQTLYLADVAAISAEDFSSAMGEVFYDLDPEAKQFADKLSNGTLSEMAELDKIIQSYAHNWKLSRMSAVDRSILRMATYEIIHCPEIPLPAVIDEAIEMAKRFSTENSGRFINGVLDRLKEQRRADKAEPPNDAGTGN